MLLSSNQDEPGAVQLATLGAEAADSFWLPVRMRESIPVQDQKWIANTLYHSKKLQTDLKLWYEPPLPALIYHQTPTPNPFSPHC